jgi:hypothetical protein
VNITTLCYNDSSLGENPLPIPFSYDNGILDIHIQDNVEEDLISGESGVFPFNMNLVRQLGGKGLVRSLGPNVLAWLSNEFSGTDYVVHTSGTVTKVQMNSNIGENEFTDWTLGQYSAFGNSTDAPSSDRYNYTGTEANNWGTFWVFLQPLTISYMDGDTKRYIVFNTTFTKNIPGFVG